MTEPDQFERAGDGDTYLEYADDKIDYEGEDFEEEQEVAMSPDKRARGKKLPPAGEDEQYIQDYYGNNSAGQNTLEKQVIVPHRQLKSQGGNFKLTSVDGGGEEDEEGVDLDYSYSHLDEFLRSQRGAGSLVAPSSNIGGNINQSI